MNKKKISAIILSIATLFFLVACGNSSKISKKDIEKHTWSATVDGEKNEDMAFIFTFTDDTVKAKLDKKHTNFDEIDDDTMSKEEKQMSKELAGAVIENMELEANYSLENKDLHLENQNYDLNTNFIIEKDGDNIKLTPKGDNSDIKPIILEPIKDSK